MGNPGAVGRRSSRARHPLARERPTKDVNEGENEGSVSAVAIGSARANAQGAKDAMFNRGFWQLNQLREGWVRSVEEHKDALNSVALVIYPAGGGMSLLLPLSLKFAERFPYPLSATIKRCWRRTAALWDTST